MTALKQSAFNLVLFLEWLSRLLFASPRESASVTWDIEKVSLSDEGSYECIAVSSVGTGRAQTFFDVSGNYH